MALRSEDSQALNLGIYELRNSEWLRVAGLQNVLQVGHAFWTADGFVTVEYEDSPTTKCVLRRYNADGTYTGLELNFRSQQAEVAGCAGSSATQIVSAGSFVGISEWYAPQPTSPETDGIFNAVVDGRTLRILYSETTRPGGSEHYEFQTGAALSSAGEFVMGSRPYAPFGDFLQNSRVRTLSPEGFVSEVEFTDGEFHRPLCTESGVTLLWKVGDGVEVLGDVERTTRPIGLSGDWCFISPDGQRAVVDGVALNLCLLYTSDAADERSSVDLGF